eukprot:6139081-Amphidinium_carterae.2
MLERAGTFARKDSTVAWELLRQFAATSSQLADAQWFFLEGERGEFSSCWRYASIAEMSGSFIDVVVWSFQWPLAAFERLAAILHRCADVIVGNERSAGCGNGVIWEGVEV